MSSTFSSLSVPNYRRYFTGCLSGNLGNWMSATAKSWMVLVELTASSATTLGWLATVMFLPQFVLQPVGGMLADRFPKRRIALITQSALCLSATTMAILVLSGQIKLWMVFALAAFDGTVTAFDGPARQSFVSELVPLPQLANAIGLNSSSWNAARLFGPAVAGLLIAVFGTGHAFAINACSFLVMIVMLIRMDPSQFYGSKADGRAAKGAGAQLAEVADPSSAGSDQRSPADAASGHNQTRSATNRRSGGLSAGLRYVFDRPFLTLLFFIAFMMGTFGFNYNITNTLMSTTVFDRGPGEYGLLGSVMGIGSLTGALLSARRDRPRLRLIVIFLAGFALSLVASALAPNFIAFAATMVPIGLCSVTVMVVANSMVQISIPQSVRGRVMALWGVATLGLTPAVSPILGWVGDHLGARATVWVGAGAIGLTALAVAWYLITKQQIRVDRHGHVRSSRAWEVRSH